MRRAVQVVAVLAIFGVYPASAEDVMAEALAEVLPIGDVVGDGATVVTAHVLALNPAGEPITKAELKPVIKDATLVDTSELGGGLYAIRIKPDNITANLRIRLQVRGRNEAKQTFKATTYVPSVPPRNGTVTLSANPPTITLGMDKVTAISLQLAGSLGDLSPDDLVVRTSLGEVINVTPMGEGRFSAKYVAPPDRLDRALAMISVADRNDPSRVYGALTIPLIGKVAQKVKSVGNAAILVKYQGRDFGPVETDAAGNATLAMQLAPGPNKATLITVTDGGTTEMTLALDQDETSRIWMMPMHIGLPSDSSLTIPVRLVVFTPDGQRDTQAMVHMTTSVGSISSAKHEGDGMYVADFTPATGNETTTVTITASLEGGAEVQTDTIEVPIVPARPHAIELSSTPEALGADDKEVTVHAKIIGPDGNGMAGRTLKLNVVGGKLSGDVAEQEGGVYDALLATRGRSGVEVQATVPTPATGNPLRSIIIFPTKDHLPSDGISSVMLTVLTVDEFGYPVAGVPVELNLTKGEGSLPSTVTTDASGVAQVFYTAGRTAGLINIRAVAPGDQAALSLLQGLPPVALPVSGSEVEMKLRRSWQGVVTTMRIER